MQCLGIIFPGLLQFSAELLTQSDLLTIWEMLCFQGTLGQAAEELHLDLGPVLGAESLWHV